MKGSVIALDDFRGRRAAALMVDGQLQDFRIEAPEDRPLPGAIYRARCDRPMKGQGGMMLRLPGGISGFLRQGKGLAPGDTLLVQVTGFAEGRKAVPVSPKVLFKSRNVIVTPDAPGVNISRAIRDEEARVRLREIVEAVAGPVEEGVILRSVAADESDDDIAADLEEMLALARQVMADREGAPELLVEGDGPEALAWREWPRADQVDAEAGSFARHGVLEALDLLLSGREKLPGGGEAYVEATRALVAVDVNTGGDTSLAAGLKTNIELARILPRALRNRGLGGQIVVDFAPQAKKDRRQLEQVLRAAFKADSSETALVGWTALGLFELQRKRDRLPLTECLK